MPLFVGFIAAAIAVVAFGSNYVPVKKFETGDGMFFQWILCIAIWMTGLVAQLVRDSPQFQPFAMIGGILWCHGNLTVVPIIKMLGLGLGLLIWGMVSLIVGWMTGNFGLFGLTKDEVASPVLNYCGFALAVCSVAIYAFVKPSVSTKVNASASDSNQADEIEALVINTDTAQSEDEEASWVDKLNLTQRRLAGVILSIMSGICYGVNFDPPQWLMDHNKGSSNALDYVFSHFTGIILTSTFYFLLYCMTKWNKPILYPQVVLPGFLAGILWAIAQISFFIANQELGFVVSFPIISTGPGAVGAIWGVVLFHEIQGLRNLIMLGCAISVNILAVVLISLSKVSF